MKITLAEIKALEPSLAKIFDKDLNITVAYRLSSLLAKLAEEMKRFEENRVKLVKKHGTQKEDTVQFEVPPEKTKEFYEELNALLQIEVKIDFEPIPLKDLGDITLSATDVMKLDGKVIIEKAAKKKSTKKSKKTPVK